MFANIKAMIEAANDTFKPWAEGTGTPILRSAPRLETARSTRNPLRAPVIAASMALFAFLQPVAADAAPNSPSSCQKKYQACQQRCEGRVPAGTPINIGADMLVACINRTCNKQFDHCMKNASTGGGGKLETPPAGHNPRPEQASGAHISGAKDEPVFRPSTNNSSPLGTGILDSGNGMGGNGPSATGSPASGGMPKAPPAAPPVILR